MIQSQYIKNIGKFFPIDSQKELLKKTFTIIGCGGNGEYFADFLTRLGVKKIILFDGDKFEPSNRNRQIFYKLNCNKAAETANKLKEINSSIDIEYYDKYFDEKFLSNILNSDMIIYCADYLYPLKEAFKKIANIPILFQGITENNVGGIIFNKNKDELYRLIEKSKYSDLPQLKTNISQPACICALSAAIGCVEIIKYFTQENYQSDIWFKYNLLRGLEDDKYRETF